MKNLFKLFVATAILLAPTGASAKPVLTDGEAGKVAFTHFVKNHGDRLNASQGVRVDSVNLAIVPGFAGPVELYDVVLATYRRETRERIAPIHRYEIDAVSGRIAGEKDVETPVSRVSNKEAAAIALKHWVSANGEIMIPEQEIRASKVAHEGNRFVVTLSMWNKIENRKMFDCAQYTIDATTGLLVSVKDLRTQAPERTVIEILTGTSDATLAADVATLLENRDQTEDLLVQAFQQNEGDKIVGFCTVLALAAARNLEAMPALRGIAKNVKARVMSCLGNDLSRESLRLLGEITQA